jgi:small subunit ribosomal protein S13
LSSEFNYIVRIRGTNIDGTKKLAFALCQIRGVGLRVIRSIVSRLKLDENTLMGDVSNSDVSRIEEAIENPENIDLPKWLLNRRGDPPNGRGRSHDFSQSRFSR